MPRRKPRSPVDEARSEYYVCDAFDIVRWDAMPPEAPHVQYRIKWKRIDLAHIFISRPNRTQAIDAANRVITEHDTPCPLINKEHAP